MKIGVFLHFDYTLKGMLFNELRCYNDIFDHPNIEKIYVFDYKGKFADMCKDFDFEYTRVLVNGVQDVEKFRKVDVLFTWDWYQDFFAGTISPKAVDLYKILSIITNEQALKIYFRICDSKHFMRDYKRMIQDRLSDDDSGRKFAERNEKLLHALDNVKTADYNNVYFLCNGSRSIADWSWVTLTKSMPFLDKKLIQDHSVYLSDDVLFRYTECYEELSYLDSAEKIEMLYHVGNLNAGKVSRIKEIMKKSDVPLFLRTAPRTLNDGLKVFKNVQLVEETLFRKDMYIELNKYLAYLFVGKGDETSYYFNKTLYDASIARTVFLIYGKIDSSNIYGELSEYIFNTAEELRERFEWIKENYAEHLETQRNVLLKNLSDESMEIFERKDI